MPDVDIEYTLDPSGYLVGVNQIDAANQKLASSMSGVTTASTGLAKALAIITPSRAATAGMLAFAAGAAQTEQQLSGLAATTVTTGASLGKLTSSIRQTARDLPIGFQGAKDLTEQFTKMGIAGAGSEKQISQLVTASAKLGGATGENMQALAQGMVELSRASGNQNLDPVRFEKLSDSLTTIAAKSGASATGILSFSKAIAPMANAAGIGTTQVLGISAAFSRMGEDGFAAANAINKMMSDMSRSVREGSPEMRNYAQIVGKTTAEFEALYKAKPAEALTQVTEAIARSGSGGPRALEQIGIEGVRGQRALQNLVASGGLRPAIEQATAGYGSGATAKAADEAFKGLNDSITELSATSKELADNLGSPLLKPLTAFTDLIKQLVGPLASVAGSRVGQGVITAGLIGGGLLMGGKAATGILGTAALARQGLTSGPVTGLLAGLTGGRRGRGVAALVEAGEELGPVTGRVYEAATGLRERYQRGAGAGGPGMMTRIRENARAYGHGVAQEYLGMVAQGFTNATVPVGQRRSSIEGPLSAAAERAGDRIMTGGLKETATAMKDFHKEIKATTGSTASMRTSFGTLLKAMQAQEGFMKQVGKDIGAGAGRVGRGLASMGFTPAGLGIAAGVGAVSYGASRYAAQQEELRAFTKQDIRGVINAYREAAGVATGQTVTFASQGAQAAQTLAAGAVGKGFKDIKSAGVTDADRAAAAGTKDKVVHKFAKDPKTAAAQITAMNSQGLTGEDAQGIKVDLLRQFDPETVNQILKMLPDSVDASTGPVDSKDRSKAMNQLASGITTGGRTTWGNILTLGGGSPLSDVETAAHTPGFLRRVSFAPGGGFGPGLGKETKSQIDDAMAAIGQQYDDQLAKFGQDYADQERAKSVNALVEGVRKSGRGDVYVEVAKKVTAMYDEELTGEFFTPSAVAGAGGDVTKVIATRSKAVEEMNRRVRQGQEQGGGQIAAVARQDPNRQLFNQLSGTLGKAFDVTGTGPMAKAVQAFAALPNVSNQTQAVNQIIASADQAGTSMGDLAIAALEASKAVGTNTDQFRLLSQVMARAQSEMARRQVTTGMTPGQAQVQNLEFYGQLASRTPTTEAEAAQQEAAKGAYTGELQSAQQRLVQRLQMQRQFDIQSTRATEDFNRSRAYAEFDYQTQVDRTNRNFRISQERAQHQYQLSVARAEEDFNTQRERAYRDFAINMTRAEEDFQTARARQIRDFNKNLARQIEDAAKTMYDPYTRIQTKATYDAKNLLLNMQEQTEALAKQKDQLDAIRQMGLSQQAIDVLGLGKTENAQQLNNLMADALSNPEMIAQINKAATDRAAAAGGLFTDQSNTDLRRAREDQAQALKDAEADFTKNMGRARADLAKSMGDSEKDFHKSMVRNATDFAYNLSQSRRDLATTLGDMEKDKNTSMTRMDTAFNLSMTRMTEDIHEADLVIAGDFATLAAETNKAIHGQAVDWQALLKTDTQSWVTDMQKNVIPKIESVYSSTGVVWGTGKGTGAEAYDPTGTKRRQGGTTKDAEGGLVPGHSPSSMADDVPAMLTSGEYVQPVGVVSHYGVGFMDALRRREIPKENYATGGLVEFAQYLKRAGYAVSEHPLFGGVHPVHTAGSQHYNKRGPGGGGAIDVNADPWLTKFTNEKRAIDQIVGLADDYGLRTIWQMAGHFNHAHFDIGAGADMMPKGYKPSGGGTGQIDIEAIIASLDQTRGGMYGKLTAAWLTRFRAAATGASPASDVFKGAGAVAQWADEVLKVFGMLGRGNGELGAVLRRIELESGGNPKAINLWDSNAKAGVPSKGLMQVIDPTFKAYRSKALPNDIWNPLANIYAGANYAIKRYGSLAAIDPKTKPTGYDGGGWLMPGQLGANRSGMPEPILTGDQWKTLSSLAATGAVTLEQSRGMAAAHGVPVNVSNNQSYTYDNRNDFGGAHITVQSADPDDMARKLEAKEHASRLNQTAGVRRNR